MISEDSSDEKRHRRDVTTTVPFRGLDPYGEVRIYQHGLLPHWRQPGCTYFVTFRLADALPRNVVEDWKSEHDEWLRREAIDPEKESWRNELRHLSPEKAIEFERDFGEKRDRFLDAGYGSCLLRENGVGLLLDKALRHFHEKRVWTGDYVVMPNHVHALLRPMEGFDLEDLVHSIKSFTSHEINKICGREGTVWQEESYDRIVRNQNELSTFQDYIQANPAKANLRQGSYRISERMKYEITYRWRPAAVHEKNFHEHHDQTR